MSSISSLFKSSKTGSTTQNANVQQSNPKKFSLVSVFKNLFAKHDKPTGTHTANKAENPATENKVATSVTSQTESQNSAQLNPNSANDPRNLVVKKRAAIQEIKKQQAEQQEQEQVNTFAGSITPDMKLPTFQEEFNQIGARHLTDMQTSELLHAAYTHNNQAIADWLITEDNVDTDGAIYHMAKDLVSQLAISKKTSGYYNHTGTVAFQFLSAVLSSDGEIPKNASDQVKNAVTAYKKDLAKLSEADQIRFLGAVLSQLPDIGRTLYPAVQQFIGTTYEQVTTSPYGNAKGFKSIKPDLPTYQKALNDLRSAFAVHGFNQLSYNEKTNPSAPDRAAEHAVQALLPGTQPHNAPAVLNALLYSFGEEVSIDQNKQDNFEQVKTSLQEADPVYNPDKKTKTMQEFNDAVRKKLMNLLPEKLKEQYQKKEKETRASNTTIYYGQGAILNYPSYKETMRGFLLELPKDNTNQT